MEILVRLDAKQPRNQREAADIIAGMAFQLSELLMLTNTYHKYALLFPVET